MVVGEGFCRMAHQTLSGAPAMSPTHWVPTVGALTCGATGQSGDAPDRSCSLSGVPSAPALTSARAVAHCWSLFTFCRRLLVLLAITPLGTPDSPVNYSGVAPQNPEASELEGIHPSAPDTVRWCTRQSMCQTRAAFGCLLIFLFEPFLDFLLVCVEPLAPIELIIWSKLVSPIICVGQFNHQNHLGKGVSLFPF
jgi:hypothetical protein